MNILLTPQAEDLLSRMPTIRRARGWRLYTQSGTRILDMYSDGGRSAIGRKTGQYSRQAKASIDMGLVSNFPTIWEQRLAKQILQWIPGSRGVRFFATEEQAATELARMNPDAQSRIHMPFGEFRTDSETISSGPLEAGTSALVILPAPPLWTIGVLADSAEFSREPGMGGRIPAARFAVAARALADYAEKLDKIGEDHWGTIDPFIGHLFRRSGPWLYPLWPAADHEKIFMLCLEKGLLISPDHSIPSFVPGEFDKGEVAPLRELARTLG